MVLSPRLIDTTELQSWLKDKATVVMSVERFHLPDRSEPFHEVRLVFYSCDESGTPLKQTPGFYLNCIEDGRLLDQSR